MKPTRHTVALLTSCVAAIALLACGSSARPALIAFDGANDAAYDDGWQSGDNGGSGFGPWTLDTQLRNPASGGLFIGDSASNGNPPSGDINTGGEAFGLYANSSPSDTAFAIRSFTGGALAAGQTFSIDMDNGLVGAGSQVGFSLVNGSGNACLSFRILGGEATYQVVDSSIIRPTLVPVTDDGLSIDVMLGAGSSYTLSVNDVIAASGTLIHPDPAEFRVLNGSAGNGPAFNSFFNSFAVVPEPGALAMVAIGGLAMLRRRARIRGRGGRGRIRARHSDGSNRYA